MRTVLYKASQAVQKRFFMVQRFSKGTSLLHMMEKKHRGMQIAPINVSNALQRIYHEINSQLISLNFKAVLLCKNITEDMRTPVQCINSFIS